MLANLHAKGNKQDPIVLAEVEELKETIRFERENANVSFLELFRPRMIKRTFIACSLQTWSQLTGMPAMMLYVTYIFGMASLSGNVLLISSSIQYVIFVVVTIPGLLALDRFGRRPLLLLGSTLMGTWLFAVSGIMATYGHPAPPSATRPPEESWELSGPASTAVIACTYLFVASFAFSWGPVPWVYAAEIFPLRVRAKGVSLATSFCWIFFFAETYFVPVSFENINWKNLPDIWNLQCGYDYSRLLDVPRDPKKES